MLKELLLYLGSEWMPLDCRSLNRLVFVTWKYKALLIAHNLDTQPNWQIRSEICSVRIHFACQFVRCHPRQWMYSVVIGTVVHKSNSLLSFFWYCFQLLGHLSPFEHPSQIQDVSSCQGPLLYLVYFHRIFTPLDLLQQSKCPE